MGNAKIKRMRCTVADAKSGHDAVRVFSLDDYIRWDCRCLW